MTEISRRLDQIIKKELSKTVIPIRMDEGILVGDIIIQDQGNRKQILRNGDILFSNIYLNRVAVAIANLLALRKTLEKIDQIYQLDQEYGKWFTDNQHILAQHKKAKDRMDFDRADVLWARYQESRDRALSAKIKAERLIDQR